MENRVHLAKQLDADIEAIRSDIIRMGALAEQQFRAALQAFVSCDVAAATALVARDRSIDRLELDIDRKCANLIARHQPVAIDLRFVVVIGKIVTDLERVGDESKKIAKATHRGEDWKTRQSLAREICIAEMGQLSADLLKDSLDAYVRLDPLLAERARRSDKPIDAACRSICQRLTLHMMAQPLTVPAGMELFSIAKSIERIGDHAKKIAKHVIFIVSGQDIRHKSARAA